MLCVKHGELKIHFKVMARSGKSERNDQNKQANKNRKIMMVRQKAIWPP